MLRAHPGNDCPVFIDMNCSATHCSLAEMTATSETKDTWFIWTLCLLRRNVLLVNSNLFQGMPLSRKTVLKDGTLDTFDYWKKGDQILPRFQALHFTQVHWLCSCACIIVIIAWSFALGKYGSAHGSYWATPWQQNLCKRIRIRTHCIWPLDFASVPCITSFDARMQWLSLRFCNSSTSCISTQTYKEAWLSSPLVVMHHWREQCHESGLVLWQRSDNINFSSKTCEIQTGMYEWWGEVNRVRVRVKEQRVLQVGGD